MNTSSKNKRIILFVIAVLVVVGLAYSVYKDCETQKNKQNQAQAWEDVLSEYDAYCETLPGKIKEALSLGNNITISIEKRENTYRLDTGEMMFFFYNDVIIQIHDDAYFSKLHSKAKYDFMKKYISPTKRAAMNSKDDYLYLSLSQFELKEATDHTISFNTNVHIEVYDDEVYSLWDSVDAVCVGNKIIYNPLYVSEEKSTSTTKSGSKSNSSGKSTYNGMMTDPDDYDNPDDYAEDAWGIDFDDYDEAYDYWEDW